MGNSRILTRLPVLRLLLPMMVGIVAWKLFPSIWLPVVFVSLSVVGVVAIRLFARDAQSRLRARTWHIVPLSLAMIAIGWIASQVASPPTIEIQSEDSTACARIETVRFNEKSMVMQLKLLYSETRKGKRHKHRATHMILSTRGCDYDMSAGDLIAFPLNPERIRNMGNPDEMDYASYMLYRGFAYSQHCDVSTLMKVGTSPTIMTRAFNLRQQLRHRVVNSSMTPLAQSLVLAMLLGDDELLDSDVRDEFSQAGVAHVLALSGLHVTILSLFIWFLLFPIDYLRGKRLRLVLTLLLLVGYDVLTGLSPSVVRASVMMGFVFASRIFYRKSTPLNSLAAAALVILVFSPGSLYSVGFQLSFITVASLLIFYELFEIWKPSNKVLNYFYTIVVTSLVALISTIVLTAYYFNTVSVVSVLANLVLMPVVFVFMVVGAVVVLLFAMGGEIMLLSQLVNKLSTIMNDTASTMSSWHIASSNVYLTWVAVVVYYAMLVLIVLWIYHRNVRYLLAAGIVFAAGLVHGLVTDARVSRNGLVVFNAFNSTPVLYYNNSKALLWVPDVDSDYDLNAFCHRHRAFLAHHNIDSVQLVDSAMCQLPGGIIKSPYARLCGLGFIAVGRGRWKSYERTDSSDIRFDYAVVTKRYHSDISVLNELIDCDTIIFSGGIYEDDLPNLLNECEQRKVPFYNIKSNGAFILSPYQQQRNSVSNSLR